MLQPFAVQNGDVELLAIVVDDNIGFLYETVDGGQHLRLRRVLSGEEINLLASEPLGSDAQYGAVVFNLVDGDVLLPQTPNVC